MTGYQVAHLDDIPKRDNWIPIRDHFGIGAFGVNTWTAAEAGEHIIPKHSETLAGHEELYLVSRGHATFAVDGEEIEAPAGTLVFVRDPAARRAAVATEVGTTVVVIGAKPGEAFHLSPWEESWAENQESMALYRKGRYAEAADVLREAVERYPRNPGLVYNLACFDAMAGGPADRVVAALTRAIELNPDFRELARTDTDFDPVRSQAAFRDLVEESG